MLLSPNENADVGVKGSISRGRVVNSGRRFAVAIVALGVASMLAFLLAPGLGPAGNGAAYAAKIADTVEPADNDSKSPAEPGKSRKTKKTKKTKK